MTETPEPLRDVAHGLSRVRGAYDEAVAIARDVDRDDVAHREQWAAAARVAQRVVEYERFAEWASHFYARHDEPRTVDENTAMREALDHRHRAEVIRGRRYDLARIVDDVDGNVAALLLSRLTEYDARVATEILVGLEPGATRTIVVPSSPDTGASLSIEIRRTS